jgi:hypothetical protein
MASFGFAFPIRPGKEDLFRQSLDEIRSRMDEYQESRHRARVTMERVWLQRNEDGSLLIPIYVEADNTFEGVLDAFQNGSEFDRWFLEVNSDITGIDFEDQSPPPSRPSTWAAGRTPLRSGCRVSLSRSRSCPARTTRGPRSPRRRTRTAARSSPSPAGRRA